MIDSNNVFHVGEYSKPKATQEGIQKSKGPDPLLFLNRRIPIHDIISHRMAQPGTVIPCRPQLSAIVPYKYQTPREKMGPIPYLIFFSL